MINIPEFESRLAPAYLKIFQHLSNPAEIQAYLDSVPYIAVDLNRSPLRVMTDGQAHCLDGGIFAALALARLGHRPLIMDLVPETGADDDHVLALFQNSGNWGCIAKSNYAFLRFREPVYRNLRELAMTYFECYTNNEKQKTLRGYTRPLDLSAFAPDWMWSEDGIAAISQRFYMRRPIPLISREGADTLSLSDERFYQANTLGTNFDWVFGVRDNS
ncbi:MAG TPA: hypothetical protein VF359_04450 [Anaerolineales bacterium]